jgi:hypothetical protein
MTGGNNPKNLWPERVPGGALPAPPPIRPCWVTDRYGRLPGLLLEWRRTGSGWQGRVVRPVLEDGGWIVVEEWMPAELLEAG